MGGYWTDAVRSSSDYRKPYEAARQATDIIGGLALSTSGAKNADTPSLTAEQLLYLSRDVKPIYRDVTASPAADTARRVRSTNYGDTPEAEVARAYRENVLPGGYASGRNVAVFAFVDQTSGELMYAAVPSLGGKHSERIFIDDVYPFLPALAVPRGYSEFEMCGCDYQNCHEYTATKLPATDMTYSFPYRDKGPRRTEGQHVRRALFRDLNDKT